MTKINISLSQLKRLASKRDFTVIECVVGFAVVPHPVTKSLISTTHSTGSSIIMMERLTKELVKTSDGPVNLVETMPFTFLFQKTLTSELLMFVIVISHIIS